MIRLNLGCGSHARPGWVNADIAKQDGVDVVHDLDVPPWPFSDGTVSEIDAIDVFEHLNNPVLFMAESHRILKPRGALHIQTAYWRSIDSYTDPTHKRHCTEFTFDYWIPGTVLHQHHNAAYGAVSFQKVAIQIGATGQLDVTLRKA